MSAMGLVGDLGSPGHKLNYPTHAPTHAPVLDHLLFLL
jgi:hypothetical protein